MNLLDLQIEFDKKLSVVRAIQRTLISYECQLAFELADDSDIAQVQKWLDNLNLYELRHWIKKMCREEDTIRELRIKAQRLGITNYGRMNKGSLLSAIHQKEDHGERRENQNNIESNIQSQTNIALM